MPAATTKSRRFSLASARHRSTGGAVGRGRACQERTFSAAPRQLASARGQDFIRVEQLLTGSYRSVDERLK